MRIGIDCRLWNESGVGRYTRNLVLELQKIDKKNQYVLFTVASEVEQISLLITNAKWEVVEADVHWHTIKEQLVLPSILREHDLDLMHFPYFSVPVFYNKPFVVTIHDLILHHFPTGQASTLSPILYTLKHKGYKSVVQIAADRSRSIITVSEATATEIVDHLSVPREKVFVTPEGVDNKISNSKFQIQNKVKNTKFEIPNSKYFLYVGNAYPHKNLNKLIDAFLSLSIKDIQLILVGREDYFYKRLMKKYQFAFDSNDLLYFGFANDEELAALYQNAAATVVPSLMEGFGLPALEAMANNCLVAGSNISSLREICGEAALYFDPKEVGSIISVLANIAKHDAKQFDIFRKKGLEQVKNFSWETMARKTLEVYEESV